MSLVSKEDIPGNLGGLTSFIVAGLSAAVSVAAIMEWHYMAGQQLDLEGAAAFSADLVPLLKTFSGMFLGAVALLIFVLSFVLGKKRPLRRFSFYHAAALLMLTPSTYLLVRMLEDEPGLKP